MTYRWASNPAVTRQLGGMEQRDREDLFRVMEALEDDPRSRFVGAYSTADDDHPGVWMVTFGRACVLSYRIVEDAAPPRLEILQVDVPPSDYR